MDSQALFPVSIEKVFSFQKFRKFSLDFGKIVEYWKIKLSNLKF